MRGSRDGFKFRKFKKKCFVNGNTLILCKTLNTFKTELIIGGFTDKKWKYSQPEYEVKAPEAKYV